MLHDFLLIVMMSHFWGWGSALTRSSLLLRSLQATQPTCLLFLAGLPDILLSALVPEQLQGLTTQAMASISALKFAVSVSTIKNCPSGRFLGRNTSVLGHWWRTGCYIHGGGEDVGASRVAHCFQGCESEM